MNQSQSTSPVSENNTHPPHSQETTAEEIVDQFRHEVEAEVAKAIDRHEFKMTEIGILTLAVFAGVIALVIAF